MRQRAQSFDDHFTQATLFWNSLTPVEREHEVGGFSFELSKVADPAIVARMVSNLANVDADLAGQVAANLGLTARRRPRSATHLPCRSHPRHQAPPRVG